MHIIDGFLEHHITPSSFLKVVQNVGGQEDIATQHNPAPEITNANISYGVHPESRNK